MLRRSFAWIVVGSTAVLIAACAAPSRYASIDLRAGGTPSEIQQLAARAQTGEKSAQLELGIRYEQGRGVPTDLKRAAKLYRSASRDEAQRKCVYSPAIGGAPAGIVSLQSGGSGVGLVEAKVRLDRLKAYL